MGIQVKRTASEPLPAGMYAATFEDLTQEEGKFGPQLKVKFLIEEEEFAGKTLTGWASLTFSPKSKLFAWVKSAVFGGRDIPESYQNFDTDHLIGRRVYLTVDTAKGSDGEVYNKVTSVLPYRPAKAQPTPAPRPTQPAQPPATQPRAASAAPSTPNDPPDWPELDEAKLTDPGEGFGGEDVF